MKLDASIAAVVTGGASGLGEGTARALAAKGVKVALFDLNEERGEVIAQEIGRPSVAPQRGWDALRALGRRSDGAAED